jgi:hypothetical protein
MIKQSDWRSCFNDVQQHRRLLSTDRGIFVRKEIHARELVSGRGNIAHTIIGKHIRSRIYFGLLTLISKMPIRLFNVCLDVKGAKSDPHLLAWDRMLNRIERTLLAQEEREIPLRKRLVELVPETVSEEDRDKLKARLLDYHPKAIIIADEGRQREITRAVRKMSRFNPIPSDRGGWPEGRTKNIQVERIIEDPIFKKSEDSFFVQLADCAAFALLKRESIPTENVTKYGLHEFFDRTLTGVCWKPACRKDPLGIVRD